ncbi:protein kinase [candidate division KSB1 bacterium]|nr:protein kinase [candidate division KSB1 bacterium]
MRKKQQQQINPFVIGQWVRGGKFFGREDLMAELLEGSRTAVWVAGLRRMGKTSLLREIERRVLQNARSPYLPVYWDMEGASDDATLRESLLAALDETSGRFAAETDWEKTNTSELLRKIQQAARLQQKTLLLLCDEVEALLAVAQDDPHVLSRLRRVMQGSADMRCIVTATRRLARLETLEATETSPFLHGFTPPLYLPPLRENECQALLRQGGFSEPLQAELYRLSGGHPFLIQVLAKRMLEFDDLEEAFSSMQHDDALLNFFRVDYQTLQPVEQALLRRCAQSDLALSETTTNTVSRTALQTLRALGLLVEKNGSVHLRAPLLKTWLSAVAADDATNVITAPAWRALQRGDRIGAYEILHEIARGGMGVVYCGRDVHLQRLVALKLIHPEATREASQRARMLAEARALSQLNHPNIAVIYTVEFIGETPCLCMEYLAGMRLDDWAHNPEKKFAEKLEVARQIASALAAAHRAGIIHRDLKPSNIIVNAQNHAKLLDFGIARKVDAAERLTQTGQTPGTPAYMSPEQISNLEVDERSDVFSLGVLFYELFTGQRPFSGDNFFALAYAIVNENPISIESWQINLREDLVNLIKRSLQKLPQKRFADAQELLLALEQVSKKA